MKVLRNPSRAEALAALKRPSVNMAELMERVTPIFDRVVREGDKAVRTYTSLFDKVELTELEVPRDTIDVLAATVTGDLQAAIHLAAANIEAFHRTQHRYEAPVETMSGVKVWRRPIPLQRAGLYAPGGSSPEFSAVLMLGVPARLASCDEIILCTPPQKDGTLHPVTAAAAVAAGIHRIFLIGGAQAIAALAIGTDAVPRVDKIFGSGNQYVNAAKQLALSKGVAIDMPSGPSELLLIADDSAPTANVAIDLLCQVEKDTESQLVLITTSARIIAELDGEIEAQLGSLPQLATQEKALSNILAILVNDIDEALAISNDYAPEQLILAFDDPEYAARNVQHAGTVFLGHYSPQSVGDYASGTNRTVPTNGNARAYAGVSLDSFVRKVTFQQLTRQGLASIGKAVQVLAKAEGRDARAQAIHEHLKDKK